MIGNKLANQVMEQGVNGEAPNRLTLVDLSAPPKPKTLNSKIDSYAYDLTIDGVCSNLAKLRPDIVYFLAAVVSSAAEEDFGKAFQINVQAVLTMLEAFRENEIQPRFIFTSSLAVYGPPFSEKVPEDMILRPSSSYGTQKAMSEFMISDYTRKGFLDGLSLRLPTIVVRPGVPNLAASGFLSSIIREPLAGLTANLPVPVNTNVWIASPDVAVKSLLMAAGLSRSELGNTTVFNLRGLSVSVAEMIETLKNTAGQSAVSLVIPEDNPTVDRIVRSWPHDFETTIAESFGFPRDANFGTIVEQYLAEAP